MDPSPAPDPIDMDESTIMNGICDGDNPEPKPAQAILDSGSGAASNAKKYASNPNLLASTGSSSSSDLPSSSGDSFGSKSNNSSGSFQRIDDIDEQQDAKLDEGDLVVMEPSSKSMDTLNLGSRRMSRLTQLQGDTSWAEKSPSNEPVVSLGMGANAVTSPPTTLKRGISRSTTSLAPVRPPSGIARRPSKGYVREPPVEAVGSRARRQSAMASSPPLAQSRGGSKSNLLGSRANLIGSKSNLSGSAGNLLGSRSNLSGSSGNLLRRASRTTGAGGVGSVASNYNKTAADNAVVEIDAALHNAERTIRASALSRTTLPSIGGRGITTARESMETSSTSTQVTANEEMDAAAPKGREASIRLANPDNFTESFRTRIDAVNRRKLTMIKEQLASMEPKVDVPSASQPLSDSAAAVTARLYNPTPAKPPPHTIAPPKRPGGAPPSASTSRRPVPPLAKSKTQGSGMEFFDAFAKGASSVEELRRSQEALKGGDNSKTSAATAGVVGDMPLRDGALKQIHTYSVGNLTIIKTD